MGRDADKEIKYLEELVKKEKDLEVKDRLRAILLLKKKFKQCKVAKILGITERTVYNWKVSYNQSELFYQPSYTNSFAPTIYTPVPPKGYC